MRSLTAASSDDGEEFVRVNDVHEGLHPVLIHLDVVRGAIVRLLCFHCQ